MAGMDTTAESSIHQTNRLRAAVALIPIVESGLRDSKVSQERAAHLAAFCEWAVACQPVTDEEQKLQAQLIQKLEELKARFTS